MTKKNLVLGLSLVFAIGIGLWYSQFRRGKDAPVAKQGDKAKKEIKKPEPEQKEKRGALSFWCGEIIIGEGDDEGKLELVGHKGERSVILSITEEGFFPFDSIAGMEKDEMYIRLNGEGEAPMIYHSLCKEEQQMHPVYELTQEVKKGRIGPLVLPHVVSPVQEMHRQKGQKLEGRTWHLGSYKTQVYGQ